MTKKGVQLKQTGWTVIFLIESMFSALLGSLRFFPLCVAVVIQTPFASTSAPATGVKLNHSVIEKYTSGH